MCLSIKPLKYYFSKNKTFYKLIFQLIGCYPGKTTIYKVAFTHKSASRQFNKSGNFNNERLEFLGDAILAAIVADYIFSYFPYKNEGYLTKLRARLVSREQLNEIALKMGLQYHIISQNKLNGTKNIYGNALEALIGAVYIDKGYKKTKEFIINRIIGENINLAKVSKTDSDYKSQLIEWAQKNKVEVTFDDNETENKTNHILTFTSNISVNNKQLGQGTGLSKKEAQQNASKEALTNIDDFFF